MKNITGCLISVLTLSVLTGCSYIQNMFPDKERDYQYTTELPVLNWPTGLRENQAGTGIDESSAPPAQTELNPNNESSAPAANTPPPASTDTSAESPSPSEQSSTEVVPAEDSDVKDELSSITIVRYDDGESRLRLGTGAAKSWRVVNKAISHNSIEVTERNHDEGYIKIQYDPDEQKPKDESFMDEFNFFLKGISTHEQEYLLKFEEHDHQTDVIVLNDEHLPLLNDNNTVRLLKRLSDTIKADLAQKPK